MQQAKIETSYRSTEWASFYKKSKMNFMAVSCPYKVLLMIYVHLKLGHLLQPDSAGKISQPSVAFTKLPAEE